uniref:NusG-like N-terminal domain-containing protein n=1 Tax=uncultured SAR11 cluster alpha proteobacterium H17925_38M03 TaxID=715037 RepID=E7C9Y6_9PROT|nr:hypothetical protein [uncultured SAR11 cluster alpha proteobacterium H17925_38M03]
MWAVIKIEKKKLNFFTEDLKKKLGKNFIIYNPKVLIQKYKNNKLISSELELLGDYLFCFHKDFKNPITINKLKFIRGLKYILAGFVQSQKEINNFVKKCKRSENDKGFISANFLNLKENTNYKFASGPFANIIFKIISSQKNKIDILMGNLKTSIDKRKFLINPA